MAKKADRQDDSTECLRATADGEINHNMDDVDKATAKLRPKNTNDQYRPKIFECKAFCRLEYDGEGETMFTLEKVHKFLFYQAHRQKRKRKKGEEIMIGHDGSKAEKGMFLYRSYVCSLNVLCGTILECIMWNNTCIAFKERTLYLFLENAPYMYFQGTYHVFLFKKHTRTLSSRNISRNTSCLTAPSLCPLMKQPVMIPMEKNISNLHWFVV
jgi:hypothetical protein